MSMKEVLVDYATKLDLSLAQLANGTYRVYLPSGSRKGQLGPLTIFNSPNTRDVECFLDGVAFHKDLLKRRDETKVSPNPMQTPQVTDPYPSSNHETGQPIPLVKPERVLRCILRRTLSGQWGKPMFSLKVSEGGHWKDTGEEPKDEWQCRQYGQLVGISRICFEY